MTVLLIPGLLCDEICWVSTIARIDDAVVADVTTQDTITQMAQDCLDRYPGTLRIAGHSMGARVAAEIAHLAPERVERLALLDTGMHPLRDGEPAKRAALVEFAHDNGMAALAERWLPPMVYEANQTPELMDELTQMVLRKTPEIHERQINALLNRPNASEYLNEITCPTLLVVGRQDQWSPVSQHEDMLKVLPNASLEVIENAGHFAPVEQPEAVADVLVPFLKG